MLYVDQLKIEFITGYQGGENYDGGHAQVIMAMVVF